MVMDGPKMPGRNIHGAEGSAEDFPLSADCQSLIGRKQEPSVSRRVWLPCNT